MKNPIPLFTLGLAMIALPLHTYGQCSQVCDANFDTALGTGTLSRNTGFSNTAVGNNALNLNTSGHENTAVGREALIDNTTGNDNNAFGTFALFNNSTGIDNTAVGNAALSNNTTGTENTSVGFDALDGTTANAALTGSGNTAEGYLALTLTFGAASFNTAVGAQAMQSTTNNGNTAVGYQALLDNTSGFHNTSTGSFSSVDNTSGEYNTADGSTALFANTTGNNNTAIGNNSLSMNTSGMNNIALGSTAGLNLTTGSNNIDIGAVGTAAESNTIRVGTVGTQTATFVAGIRGIVVTGGQPVVVTTSGQLGVKGSSARFKEAIRSMDNQSESILALRPVSFRYRKELDPKGAPQFGLIAEEVAKVDPELVVTDEQGKPFSVRYEEVNAMLLNEFLKEHRRVADEAAVNEQQSATISELKKALAQQQTQIKALSSGLQKVNTKLQMAQPTARVVTND